MPQRMLCRRYVASPAIRAQDFQPEFHTPIPGIGGDPSDDKLVGVASNHCRHGRKDSLVSCFAAMANRDAVKGSVGESEQGDRSLQPAFQFFA